MRRKIDIIILALVLIAGIFAVKNAQGIGDWWHMRVYHPPAEIVQLADDAGMSDEGKRLFYRFSPQFVDQGVLDQYCSVEKLGCIEGHSIYILKYSSDQEYNRAIVTAAHEMLHVAYSRFSASDRDKLAPLLKQELAGFGADGIVDQLQDYPQADYYNEAHSFIGSELANVSPELDAHYKQYFTDRAKATTAYEHSPDR